jgi:hypothetical protein
MAVLEYIWLDGYAHNKEHPNDVANLRAKIKVIPEISKITELEQIPDWSFNSSFSFANPSWVSRYFLLMFKI